MAVRQKLADWKRERTVHTARGLAQVLWASLQGRDTQEEGVDAGLAVLAQVELGRVEASDRGASTFALDTSFGAFELHAKHPTASDPPEHTATEIAPGIVRRKRRP